MTTGCTRTSLALAVSATLLAAQASAAQPGVSATMLEEIVVTARKREENLQEAPVAVSAFSGETLRQQGIVDLRGIANATPNMQFSYGGNGSGGGNFAQIFIRGIGQPDFIITKDPGVGIYVDGVYLARAPGSVLEMLDVERIEVLRGPQGTLFGKNTEGGAVLVTTKKPASETGVTAEIKAGAFHRRDVSASLNLPLSGDTLALRVSALSRTQDGYYRHLLSLDDVRTPGQIAASNSSNNTGDINRQSGRATLLWTPSDTFSLTLSGDATKERQTAADYQLIAVPRAANGTLAANVVAYNTSVGNPAGLPYDERWISTEPWTTYSTSPGHNNSDIWGVSATMDWDLNTVALKSITAFRDLFVQTRVDADGTPADIVASGGTDIGQRQFSEELQISGAAFDDKFNWIAGLWYFDEKAKDRQVSRQYVGLYQVTGLVAHDITRDSYRWIEGTSYAGFLHGSYAFTPAWSVEAGLRYSKESKDFTFYQFRPLRGISDFPLTTRTNDWNVVTPKVSVQYKPVDGLMIYADYTTGFKAGGFNGRPGNSSLGIATFNEENVKTTELGAKSEFFGNRLRINATAFFSDYTDIQITRLLPNGDRSDDNAGDGEVKGAELEIAAMPLEGLTLAAALGFTDFEYTSLKPGVAFGCMAGADYSNCTLPFNPGFTSNFSASYRIPMGDMGGLTLRGDVTHSDRYFVEIDNVSVVGQDAYDSIDARMAWNSSDDKWELALGGTNLTNEAIVANGVNATANNSRIVTYKPPRQWYAGVRVNF
ncbi:MAG TPA: TonB-dependent receptor [Steroidobacteraceae bacterium]|nr:TonB-dependent receptor [Steroidobacteraceae bacterium]